MPPTDREQATQIAAQLDAGAPAEAAAALAPLVYEDLRRIAHGYLAKEGREHTLQPTALVNEAYLRLIDQSRVDWRGRTHFLAVGAQMLRRVLIDAARARNADKRGGGMARVTLHDAESISNGSRADTEAIEKALKSLATVDERAAKVVEMRFFAGMTEPDIAEVLGVTERTVRNDWRAARAWLRRELAGDGDA